MRQITRTENPATPQATDTFLRTELDDAWFRLSGELRDRMQQVEQQVLAQYTAAAAYATIAKQNDELIRNEARADMDRAQSTSIGLIERMRNEMNNRITGIELHVAGAAEILASEPLTRLATLEARLESLAEQLERTTLENAELRIRLDEITEPVSHGVADGWLAGGASIAELTLR